MQHGIKETEFDKMNFLHNLSTKPNTEWMVWQNQCGQEKIKKFTINDVIKIHNNVGVSFGPRFCTHTVGVNA